MALHLPEVDLLSRTNHAGVRQLFDPLRNKWIQQTPEEYVRQRLIRALLDRWGYPPAMLAVEREIRVCGMRRRFDLLVYDRRGRPLLLAECKAPGLELQASGLRQLMVYNHALEAPFLLATNGVQLALVCVPEPRHIWTEFPAYEALLAWVSSR